MNILHIIPNLSKGGAERICLDISRELQSRKDIKFCLVVLDEKDEYSFLSKDVNIIKTNATLHLKLLGKNRINLEGLQKLVEDFNPDIIHSHLYLAELYSKHIKSKAKRFCHVHDNMHQLESFNIFNINSKKTLVKFFERNYYASIANQMKTHFVCISKDAESFINDNLKDIPKESHFFPNAIDTQLFNEINLREEGVINLVSIGSFLKIKGHDLLINMLYHLKQRVEKKLTLHLLGDGETLDSCKQLSKSLGLEDNIIFHGKVNNPERFLKESDIYVHGTCKEAFGLVLIEAMSTGTPVISTDGKGNRDFLTKENSIFLKHRDPELFCESVLELINNKELYKHIQQGGINTAKEYDIVPYVDRLITLYKNS